MLNNESNDEITDQELHEFQEIGLPSNFLHWQSGEYIFPDISTLSENDGVIWSQALDYLDEFLQFFSAMESSGNEELLAKINEPEGPFMIYFNQLNKVIQFYNGRNSYEINS